MTPEIEKRIKAVQAGRVPAGYKKTPIGVVPKEWNMTSLKDIANHVIEKNKNNAVHLTLTNSATKGVIKQEDYFDKQISNNENTDGYYLVKDGDFIYNPRISESAPCGPINRSHIGEVGIASPLYTVFRLKENVQNVDYIELYLKSPFWHRYMCGVANYGARHDRMNITNDDLFAMPLPLPPISEQKKIAEILATQDRVIELKEKLIAEKQSQKKYLMSVLLGDDFKKPFKLNGVTIDKKKWEKKNIDSVSSINGRIGFRGYTNNDITTKEEGVLSLSPSNILNNRFVEDRCTYITEMKYEESPEIQIRNNDIIFVKTGSTFGKTAYLSSFFSKATINPQLVIIRSNGLILQELLAYILQTPYFQKKVKQITVGGAVPTLSQEQLSNIIIHFPSILTEQKAIADVLSAADEEISLLQKDLEQEKLKKKSLMQLLLTGLVRVQ